MSLTILYFSGIMSSDLSNVHNELKEEREVEQVTIKEEVYIKLESIKEEF